ncbi:PWWP domain-containing protein 2A-like [Bacillus rossius redtenbacheri]|uniref:PWWP domain-containing protein 2A-like n=1 Tax=Bacillus rossius redtenbacheri TaxID=93214 RepID=UPI002FDED0BD
MADEVTALVTKILKNSKISVNVEDVLPDIIVVSYAFENKLFEGVLLDSTKKHLPCGIYPPKQGEDEKFFSLSQRYTYHQEKSGAPTAPFHIRRNIRQKARHKNSRPTVRLRPRQVLCSKCRSICNENSENVDHSKQGAQATTEDGPKRKLRSPAQSPRSLFSENHSDNQNQPVLKLPRLQPAEISNALSGNTNKMKFMGNYWVRRSPSKEAKSLETVESHELFSVSVDSGSESDSQEAKKWPAGGSLKNRMVLRKKRSVGSMEDLWDERVFEEKKKKACNGRTPVIKISFGSAGEGTVLKIPSKAHDYIPSDSEVEETAEHRQKTKNASAKAAKRALKKAKKEARKKMLGASPVRSLSGTSPNYEVLYHRKHKHKKKHKEVRRHSKCCSAGERYSAIKERCLKQKLSINLKRLNANAYCLGPNGSKSPGSCCSNSDTSDDHGEAVPDFPPPSRPLMMRVSAQAVGSCLTGDGRRIAVGDVVWGKIHGFPWWPGKVLSVSVSHADDGSPLEPQAHVAWYGSSTSSLMPCDQLSPFLETFKTRYNKKKRGPYKEAIRQATSEAGIPLQEVNVLS